MKTLLVALAVLVALPLTAAEPAASPAAARRAGAFEIETPGAGVRVFRNVDAGFPGVNSVVVERSDGLLVVDAQPTPAAARALLAAIATVTKAPVRFLVYTHPHEDAVGGASAFPSTTVIVASSAAHDLLADPSYDVGAEIRARAGGGADWKEAPRVLPVVHAAGPIVLDDSERKVIVYPLPPAHSRGDCLVDIPSSGVIAVGDVVVTDRNPYGGDARIGAWVRALNDLERGHDRRIVPLSGPVVGRLAVRRLRDALAFVRQAVQSGFTNLVPADRIVEHVLADPKLGTYFDLDAKPSFVRTIIEAAREETIKDRHRHGLP